MPNHSIATEMLTVPQLVKKFSVSYENESTLAGFVGDSHSDEFLSSGM
jgi:hypothetical protein